MCREPNVPTSTDVRNMFLICEKAALNSEAICLNLSAPGSGALAYVNPRGAGRSLPVLERLILQLSFEGGFAQTSSPVTCFRYSLMDPAPERPREEMLERDAGRALQAADETADLACAEIDHRSRRRCPLFRGVAALRVTRRPARNASASMARVMCRYQPCQDRIS